MCIIVCVSVVCGGGRVIFVAAVNPQHLKPLPLKETWVVTSATEKELSPFH